jgi:hypothetical protein
LARLQKSLLLFLASHPPVFVMAIIERDFTKPTELKRARTIQNISHKQLLQPFSTSRPRACYRYLPIIIDECQIFSLIIIAKALLICLFSRSFVHGCKKYYLKFFVLQPSIQGTCAIYKLIYPDPVHTFCLYMTSLFHNRTNIIIKVLSSSRYHSVCYGCQRLTHPPLCHGIGEDILVRILYMYTYVEATNCRTVCYLLVTSSWA